MKFMKLENSLPHSQKSPHHPRLCDIFYNTVRFCREELLAPCPNCKLKYRILSSARDCLYNIFAATLSIWGSLLHLQHEDSPSCVTGINASEIQQFKHLRNISAKDPRNSAKEIQLSNHITTVYIYLSAMSASVIPSASDGITHIIRDS